MTACRNTAAGLAEISGDRMRYGAKALLLTLLALGTACSHVHDAVADRQPQSPALGSAASLSPPELRGRRLLTQDGSRELGKVVDAVTNGGRTTHLVIDVNPALRRTAEPVILDAERVLFRRSSPSLVALGIGPQDIGQLSGK